MNTLNRQRTSGYAGLTGLFLVVTAIAQGCGNDNPEPTTPVVTGGTSAGGTGAKGGTGGTGNEAGSDNPGGSDATGGTSTGGTGAKGGTGSGATGGTGSGAKGGTGSGAKGGTGSGATGGTGNSGNEGGDGNTGQGGDGPVDCSPQGEGKNRCYPCTPTDGENVEFLNHCNDASCSHFDNEARIEGFTTPLPPL